MEIDWERGLFGLWLAGTIAWISPITLFVYDETRGFSLPVGANEWFSYSLLWAIPPILTFAVYIAITSLDRRLGRRGEVDPEF